VIVMSDHSQTPVEERVNLAEALPEWSVLGPLEQDLSSAEIAVCPAARSAMVYVLDPERRDELLVRLEQDLTRVDGIDLLAWRSGEEAAVWSPRGELRFAPGGDLVDAGGAGWSVDGELGALALLVEDGRVRSPDYPDALARLWSALLCPSAGDLLVSAAAGYEFVDWGGADHVGGGSHGSLDAGDSLGAMVLCGTGPDSADAREQWTLRDAARVVLEHFSIAS
jgi:hypothetical protein